MPTTYTDQFWQIDPYDPPRPGTVLEPRLLRITDQNDTGDFDAEDTDLLDGSAIDGTFFGDTITVELADGSTLTVTGSTFLLADGRAFFTPSNGSILTTATFQSAAPIGDYIPVPVESLGPTCFAAGTLIRTPRGDMPVETLVEGDVVTAFDGRAIAVRKVLQRDVTARELRAFANFRPVRIMAGALGGGMPARDLVLSRQHRMMVSSRIVERMFGTSAVLISAIRLTELPGIFVDEAMTEVTYVHLVFDAHEVVIAEGAPSESLLLGPMAIRTLTPESEAEIRAIFPTAFDADHTPRPACRIPTNRQQKQMVTRHLRNGVPLGMGGTARRPHDRVGMPS